MRLHRLSVLSSRGFTLIEVFVVIAILAVLGAMTWQAAGMINNREMNKTAEIQVAQLETGMNAYRTDYGDILPGGNGDEWSSHVLYTALSCDADGDGEADIEKATGERLAPYCDGIITIEDIKNMSEVINGIPAIKKSVKPTGKKKKRRSFVILDPWGGTYRYRLGYEMKESETKDPGKGINPDFDIYSLGADALGDGKSNKGDNEDNFSNIRSWQ